MQTPTATLAREQCLAEDAFIETRLFGYELLNDPLLNKGTAFSDEERDAFELHGLLPPNVATLDEQVGRRLQAYRQLPSELARYIFLRGLQDTNEVLFYAILAGNLAEMLPVDRFRDRQAEIKVAIEVADRLAAFVRLAPAVA